MTAPAPEGTRLVTESRTDLIMMLFATWLMIGLFVDGYAHTNLIDELESFFTPWHAVFYSGFLATTGWVWWIVYRNVQKGYPLRDAVPAGYGLAIVGLGFFAIGGIGDGVWHTVFGIESGIDALLSPTHFLLFGGGILGLGTPIRSGRVRNPGKVVATPDRLPLVLSLTLVTAALAFFTVYLWVPGQPWSLDVAYDPTTGYGAGEVAYGIAGIVISTLVLLTPAAIVLRWWEPSPGIFTITWVAVNAAVGLAFSMHLPVMIPFALTGGLVGDVLIWRLRPGPQRRGPSMAAMALTVVAAWSAYMVAAALDGLVRWPPELWSGAVILSGLVALGIGWLALPDPETRSI